MSLSRSKSDDQQAHHKCSLDSGNRVYELGVVSFSYQIQILLNKETRLSIDELVELRDER